MKNKKVYMLIGIALVVLCFVLAGQRGIELNAGGQRDKESKLPERESPNPVSKEKIRVLLKTSGYRQVAHNHVSLKAKSGIRLIYGERVYESNPGEKITLKPNDRRFQDGSILVECMEESEKISVLSLKRDYGIPSYRGGFELFSTAEGIVMVNELPLEEYLYAVVPSEMPASYEVEALKVQAICARSYAHNQSRSFSYPEYKAHVDDSTSFQVYGNSKEYKSTSQAVDETCGEMIWYHGKVATAYFFSTSWGKTTSIEAWGGEMTKDKAYLQSVSLCDETGEDYEKDLAWYRWSIRVPEEAMCNQIELYTGQELGKLRSVAVTKKGKGGIAQEITATGTQGKVVVKTENKIRRALGGTGCVITKNDGSETVCGDLLPSAYLSITQNDGTYVIEGGGYGHGIGMSQNGANEMAKCGRNYKEILNTFYIGVTIK